jgi:hypothetical protein
MRGAMAHNVGTLITGACSRIRKRLAEELRKAQETARNEAHLSTRGDRPFVGCSPCMAERPEGDRSARQNPPAAPRDGSSV